jgi:hypothetical protein
VLLGAAIAGGPYTLELRAGMLTASLGVLWYLTRDRRR